MIREDHGINTGVAIDTECSRDVDFIDFQSLTFASANPDIRTTSLGQWTVESYKKL
jgi:hypothetical protein